MKVYPIQPQKQNIKEKNEVEIVMQKNRTKISLAETNPATTFLSEKIHIKCIGGACPRQVLASRLTAHF